MEMEREQRLAASKIIHDTSNVKFDSKRRKVFIKTPNSSNNQVDSVYLPQS